MYLHFLSFLISEVAQVVEIVPEWRQGHVYPAESSQYHAYALELDWDRKSAAVMLTLLS